MFKTRITEMFGIEYPIIGGAMMHLALDGYAAAVSEAGGLGVLASANYKEMGPFRDALKRVKAKTDKPFAVNLNFFPALNQIDNNLYLDVMIEEGVKIVESSGHKAPEELIGRIKGAGMKLIHKCVGVRYAKKAESIGVDAITVVGYENGGATGQLDITTLCLVPRVVDNVRLPVIGGGGVADGRGLAAVLALGAEGVIVGTPLLLAEETPLHPSIKQKLCEASELDTRLVLRSLGNTHRVWKNETSDKVAELEAAGKGLEDLLPLISGMIVKEKFQQASDGGLLACGQGIGLCREVRPMREIIQDLARQAEDCMQRLNRLLPRLPGAGQITH
ncbi:MAG TPA: nitronate monooxygenase [Myxococcota bacterium]|nr:nitronate monooxygenase [Myxococcota bacterium]HRY95434.1 nitronate monooxygenase [Myxococcota bacterium]HSA22417.1 nitronate monooxygenase [Myxococcota bacterium]